MEHAIGTPVSTKQYDCSATKSTASYEILNNGETCIKIYYLGGCGVICIVGDETEQGCANDGRKALTWFGQHRRTTKEKRRSRDLNSGL